MLAAAGRCHSGETLAPALQAVERSRGGKGDPGSALTVDERLLTGPDNGGALFGHHLDPAFTNDDFAPGLTVSGDTVAALTRDVDGGVDRIDAQLLGISALEGHHQLHLTLDQLQEGPIVLSIARLGEALEEDLGIAGEAEDTTVGEDCLETAVTRDLDPVFHQERVVGGDLDAGAAAGLGQAGIALDRSKVAVAARRLGGASCRRQ
jgi:hypothetical protein